jgi:ABC transport permease subunit
MSWYKPSDIGFSLRRQLADIGHGARLFVRLFTTLLGSLKRFGLIRDQIHFLGNYSLVIIAVSGLFVGFVLGLQGYYTLQRYGSTEALGLLVTLSLVRELGPVVTALLFAGRAGSSLTAEIGLMKAGEQISVLEMMAVDPIQRILAPRVLGWRSYHAPIGSSIQCYGRHWRLGRWGIDDWHRFGLVLEPNSRRRRRLERRRQWCDQKSYFWVCSDVYCTIAGI